jgi:hypothetical protein
MTRYQGMFDYVTIRGAGHLARLEKCQTDSLNPLTKLFRRITMTLHLPFRILVSRETEAGKPKDCSTPSPITIYVRRHLFMDYDSSSKDELF